ncbi:flagellar biosynthetic protein FliR [Celeribacter sp.]|uniref:flagellar biosynthetic protein FliR n=1 Tax=Celeribacter sp. TaxID=1890673 RepID=UPI003A959F3C
MMETLADLSSYSTQAVLTAFLVFVRVSGVMAVLPAFGEQVVPLRVRLVLTLAFTLITFPAIAVPDAYATRNSFMMVRFVVAEAIAGLAIGLIIRFMVMALQIAGANIAQSTSLSQLFGGGAVDAQPAMGHVLFTGGLAIAVTLGLHEKIAVLIIRSYSFLPIGLLPDSEDLSTLMVSHVAGTFALGFAFAAPFMIASVIYNTALGVINRAMPQLMVAFVGAPAITLGGLALLLICAPFLLEIWVQKFFAVLDNPLGVF